MKILVPNPTKHKVDSEIRSYLSLLPYYKHLQERIKNPDEPFLDFYRSITRRLEERTELLQPLDPRATEPYADLFQMIAATIFPVSTNNELQYFALGTPYKFEIYFYSRSFSEYFSPDEEGFITFPKERPFEELQAEYVLMAYRLIFRKFFGVEIIVPERRTNRWIDTITGLPRYSRVHIDESFIDVKLNGDLPALPHDVIDYSSGSITDLFGLQQKFPLSLFSFEGFIIRRSIADVTVEECVTQVKNALIEMQSDNQSGYGKLRSAVETLIGLRNVEVSLSPFLQLNQRFVFYNKYSGTSILIKGISSPQEKEVVYDHLALLLNTEKKTLHITNNNGRSQPEQKNSLLASYLTDSGYCCHVVVPLFLKKPFDRYDGSIISERRGDEQ